MAKLLKPREEVKKAIAACIRAGNDTYGQSGHRRKDRRISRLALYLC